MLIEEIKFHFQLRELQRRRRKILMAFQDRFADAVEKGRSLEVKEGLRHEERFALDEWDNAIDVLTTAHLLQEARRFQLPVPDSDDETYWAESFTFGGRHLTAAGIAKLRSDIRLERKARWDLVSSRLTLLIGLLGALIGLVSILKK
jgi:hypothetical protein